MLPPQDLGSPDLVKSCAFMKQGLSQDLGTWCQKLVIVKYLGFLFFKEAITYSDKTHTCAFTFLNMYIFLLRTLWNVNLEKVRWKYNFCGIFLWDDLMPSHNFQDGLFNTSFQKMSIMKYFGKSRYTTKSYLVAVYNFVSRAQILMEKLG